jgi:acetyl esterase/lipase
VPPEDVMTRSSEPPDAVVRYAAHDDGLVDVHLPARTDRPVPLVVYVHGGFWRSAYDRTHARPLANALAEQGVAVALPEYRRGPASWRDTLADLTAVMTALPEMTAGLGLRTTSTTLVGHSAGGHLALWLANEPYDLHRTVALAPVGDLRKAVEWEMGGGAAVDWLGGTPTELPEVYDATDPATRMGTRPTSDVVVVHGDRDDAVPVASSRGLKARFGWIDYRELAGADHFDLIDPLSGAWPTVRAAITS